MSRTVREQTEAFEEQILSPYAAKSALSKGRERPISPCDVRTEFQRDRDRILHSKAFRRLKGKTQVFLAPKGDHYRTRMTHTLEVMQIARTIARALRLNEDLTEGIALGHDLGHTPFGHAGESVLDAFHPFGFRHYEQSLRVVDVLERDGQGLNLTHETREGIGRHSKGTGKILREGAMSQSCEGVVVRLADVIAYLNHDIEDAIRGEVLKYEELPSELLAVLGQRRTDRIGTMVRDVIESSQGTGDVRMSDEVLGATQALKDFMYKNVYPSSAITHETRKAKGVLEALIEHYAVSPERLPEAFRVIAERDGDRQAVCDYIAGMTDQFAIDVYRELFLPKAWGYS